MSSIGLQNIHPMGLIAHPDTAAGIVVSRRSNSKFERNMPN